MTKSPKSGQRTVVVVVACMLFVGCNAVESGDQSVGEPAMTQDEQIAELRRQAELITAEMQTIDGPNVRARITSEGQGVLVASPADAVETGGFYSIEATLADGTGVTVYVPNNVALAVGSQINVAIGRHGHYFRSLAAGGP